MTYNPSSNWDEINELRCLIIFKKLQEANFPRGMQAKYCQEMANITTLTYNSINAKVGNYKSVSGINKQSNASKNTIELYEKHHSKSINEIEAVIHSLQK